MQFVRVCCAMKAQSRYCRLLMSLDYCCSPKHLKKIKHGKCQHCCDYARCSLLAAPFYRTDPNLVYVEKTTRALWENLGQQYSQILPVKTTEAFQAYYPMQQKLIRMFRKEGVKILAGSDLGGIWIVAGFSLHQEFRELASAGLSPLEALQATTLNAAIVLKREATMESVEAGKNADVANLAKIFAVVNAGTLHSLPALEKMKRDVITAQASRPLQNMSAAIDTAHVH